MNCPAIRARKAPTGMFEERVSPTGRRFAGGLAKRGNPDPASAGSATAWDHSRQLGAWAGEQTRAASEESRRQDAEQQMKAARDRNAEACWRCGAEMRWVHGTWQCPRCKWKLGCCEGEPQSSCAGGTKPSRR